MNEDANSNNPLDDFLNKKNQNLFINNSDMISGILRYSISSQATLGKILQEVVEIKSISNDGQIDKESVNKRMVKLRQEIFDFTEKKYSEIIADLAKDLDDLEE